MTMLVIAMVALVLSRMGPLLAISVAVLSSDPKRRADARRVLQLIATPSTGPSGKPDTTDRSGRLGHRSQPSGMPDLSTESEIVVAGTVAEKGRATAGPAQRSAHEPW